MITIVGHIASDAATLLRTEPFSLFLGFGILGIVMSLLSKWFKYRV